MPATVAQIAANQANALKSTGPRTPEGKARSRGNAYKHGLTGAGIALPIEDAGEVAARFDEFAADFKPRSGVARFLVERAALMSVRMERAAKQEAATLGHKVRHAIDDFDAARVADAAGLFAGIEAAPARVHGQLLGSAEGIACLVDALLDLRDRLEPERIESWDQASGNRLDAYLGGRANPALQTRARALGLAVYGRFVRLDPTDGGHLADLDRRAWARVELGRLIDAEVARLRAWAGRLDTAAVALDRAEAPERAAFDPSAAAGLARKYEAAAERTFFRTLRELRSLDQNFAGPSQPVSPPGADFARRMAGLDAPLTARSDGSGSFFPVRERVGGRDDSFPVVAVDPRSAYIGPGPGRTERNLGPTPPPAQPAGGPRS